MASGLLFTAERIAETVGVSKAMLDQECSEEHEKEISLFLKSWKTLAPHLKLEEADIEEIDQDGKTEQEKKLKTLQKWKERFIFRATYKVLMEALLKSGRADHARQVCHLLLSPAIGNPTTGHTESEVDAVTASHMLGYRAEDNIHEMPPSTTVGALQVTSSKHLEHEIEELETQFEGLVNEAADDIGQSIKEGKVKLSRVKRSITLLPVSIRHQHIRFLQGKLSAINEAKNLRSLFSILDLYWDFMNCGLLERMIDRFGSMETQQKMKRYLERLKEFRMRTTVREFTDKWTHKILKNNLLEFTMEMGEEWMDRSLGAVEELKRQCVIKKYALPLKGSHQHMEQQD